MMFPWKLFFRFFSAMVLMVTGGFAAGHDIPLPFVPSPAPVAAPPAPAPDPSSTTTTTEAAPVDVSTTTTTTAPDNTPPVVVDPAPVPVIPPTGDPAPPTTSTTAPPKGVPAPPPVLTPAPPAPVAPVQVDAPPVCAAAATSACAPVDPAVDNSHAARVQRCQDWWNSLAAAFTANNQPEWAAKATELAGQCDAFITRWEQWDQGWQQWQQGHPKGDHNSDGHPDSGRGPNHPTPPPAQPKANQVSRHGEGRH